MRMGSNHVVLTTKKSSAEPVQHTMDTYNFVTESFHSCPETPQYQGHGFLLKSNFLSNLPTSNPQTPQIIWPSPQQGYIMADPNTTPQIPLILWQPCWFADTVNQPIPNGTTQPRPTVLDYLFDPHYGNQAFIANLNYVGLHLLPNHYVYQLTQSESLSELNKSYYRKHPDIYWFTEFGTQDEQANPRLFMIKYTIGYSNGIHGWLRAKRKEPAPAFDFVLKGIEIKLRTQDEQRSPDIYTYPLDVLIKNYHLLCDPSNAYAELKSDYDRHLLDSPETFNGQPSNVPIDTEFIIITTLEALLPPDGHFVLASHISKRMKIV